MTIKFLHKLLLKTEDILDYTTFNQYQNFQWLYLTESEIVDHLFSFSYEIKISYHFNLGNRSQKKNKTGIQLA